MSKKCVCLVNFSVVKQEAVHFTWDDFIPDFFWFTFSSQLSFDIFFSLSKNSISQLSFRTIFKYISLFIPNETELASFSGMPVTDKESAAAAAKVLFGKGVGNMIVTMGSKGSLILDGGEPQFVLARKVKAVDTTGAGDTYCGSICVALSEGKTLKEAAEFASAVSALSVTKMGAQTAIPTRAEAEAFMAQ